MKKKTQTAICQEYSAKKCLVLFGEFKIDLELVDNGETLCTIVSQVGLPKNIGCSKPKLTWDRSHEIKCGFHGLEIQHKYRKTECSHCAGKGFKY